MTGIIADLERWLGERDMEALEREIAAWMSDREGHRGPSPFGWLRP